MKRKNQQEDKENVKLSWGDSVECGSDMTSVLLGSTIVQIVSEVMEAFLPGS